MQKRVIDCEAGRRAVAKTVRAARLKANLSQEDFAERAEVHRNYIGRVERAELNISFDAVQRIAGALGWSVAELCRRAGV